MHTNIVYNVKDTSKPEEKIGIGKNKTYEVDFCLLLLFHFVVTSVQFQFNFQFTQLETIVQTTYVHF